MQHEPDQDTHLCHAYLNALFAGWQGRFAYANAMHQFTGSSRYEEILKDVKDKLDSLCVWFAALSAGEPLEFRIDSDRLSSDAKHALVLFEELRSQKKKDSALLKGILCQRPERASIEDVQQVVAFYNLQAYSREHYIKGLIYYGELTGCEDTADRWRQALPTCHEEIARAFFFYSKIGSGSVENRKLVEELWNEAVLLPGILRSQVHDLNQITGLRTGKFTFSVAEFDDVEASGWRTHGISAMNAGYWRAYQVQPEEVREWLELGFPSPGHVAAWKLRGFTPEEALHWESAGYGPVEAGALSSMGYRTPEMLHEACPPSHLLN